MSSRENQFKFKNTRKGISNKFQNRKETPKSSVRLADRLAALNFNTQKATKIIGLFCLLLSVYFLLAFTSYLFTWQEDQSYVSASNGGGELY